MSMLQKIKGDLNSARKAKADTVAMISTIYSELAMIGKNGGNRETTDDEVVTYCKKSIGNNNETIKVANEEKGSKLKEENRYLEQFVPQEASESEVKEFVDSLVGDLSADKRNMKSMGMVMGKLEGKFGNALNGGVASRIVKEALAK